MSINEMSDLKDYVQSILDEEKRADRKKKKILIGVLVVMCLWLTIIYATSTRQLSAGFIFDVVHVKGKNNITAINQQLKSMAPNMAHYVGQKLVSLPSTLRQHMMKGIDPAIEQGTTRLRRNLEAHFANLYTSGVLELSKDSETRHAQYRQLMEKVKLSTMEIVDQFYATDGNSLREMKDELLVLKDSQNLSESQKLQKQVIGAWLAMLDHRGVSWEVK